MALQHNFALNWVPKTGAGVASATNRHTELGRVSGASGLTPCIASSGLVLAGSAWFVAIIEGEAGRCVASSCVLDMVSTVVDMDKCVSMCDSPSCLTATALGC